MDGKTPAMEIMFFLQLSEKLFLNYSCSKILLVGYSLWRSPQFGNAAVCSVVPKICEYFENFFLWGAGSVFPYIQKYLIETSAVKPHKRFFQG